MKIKHLIWMSSLGVAAVALQACSDDDPSTPGGPNGNASGGAATGGAGGTAMGGAAGAETGGAATGGAGGAAMAGAGGAPMGGAGGAAMAGAGGAAGGGNAEPVAADRFCTAADRLVQPKLTDVRFKIVEGVKVEWNAKGESNVEGPTWHDGALYYSNLGPGNAGVIWKLVPGMEAVKFLDVDKAGTNGMVVSFEDKLIAARQLDGSITGFTWTDPGTSPTTIAGMYNGKPFNAPNDLTIARDGTIYFTDPSWNVPATVVDYKATRQGGGDFPDLQDNTMPVSANNRPLRTEGERIYRVTPTGAVTALDITLADGLTNLRNKPNGIMLGLDEKSLTIGGAEGIYRFSLAEDGTLSAGKRLFPATNEEAEAIGGPTDGMGRDCAGNIYVTTGGDAPAYPGDPGGNRILVFNPEGEMIGVIPVPLIDYNTNVTFGGADGMTLYVSHPNWGGPLPAGLLEAKLNVRGYPQ